MKNLYRFYWDCGRMGELHGLFVATQEEVRDRIGSEVYFGEVLGKHSEIYGQLRERDIQLVTSDQNFIEKFQLLGLEIGFNPIEYLLEEEELDE